MKIIKHNVEMLSCTSGMNRLVEVAARNCYQSPMSDTRDKAVAFTSKLINQYKHESICEHASITFKIVTDRATMAQITRHRMFSYSIQSQRYCKYDSLELIEPIGIDDNIGIWTKTMRTIEEAYTRLIKNDVKPEIARSVLPNCTATTIVMTGNIRSWLNFFSLRTSEKAQAEIREIANQMLDIIKDNDDIPNEWFKEYMICE